MLANRRAKSGNPLEAPSLEGRIKDCLGRRLSPIIAGAVLRSACNRCKLEPATLSSEDLPELTRTLERSLACYLDPVEVSTTTNELTKLAGGRTRRTSKSFVAAKVLPIESELDIHRSRTEAMALAKKCGLSSYDAIKIATVVSELSRNVLQYAERGQLTMQQLSGRRSGIRLVVKDDGPGIRNLDEIMAGGYHSETGLGMGIKGSRRVLDRFDIETSPDRGTTITGEKYC